MSRDFSINIHDVKHVRALVGARADSYWLNFYLDDDQCLTFFFEAKHETYFRLLAKAINEVAEPPALPQYEPPAKEPYHAD